MKMKHSDYLTYEIPDDWELEENDEDTAIYNNEGEGAIILSFYTIWDLENTIGEQISIMAKKFVESNNIKIKNCFILDGTKKNKTALYGQGKTEDSDFFKIWIIAKFSKIVIATYQAEKKTSEIKEVDKIIESFKFKNL